ncbi:MAG: hypothetical protein M1826_005013 [Phylliscum demangeonii]|nr:MAG: hypothetical protein M1826_005013 [Phylliscum demangeonii]
MPALLDDPTRPLIYRASGSPPYPGPAEPLPPSIAPRAVMLRDRITVATLVPFSSPDQVPPSLLVYVCEQLNAEIDKGDSYPMIERMPLDTFGPYWFGNFGAVMLLGDIARVEDVHEGKDWSKECLGSFYVKPNYPGRSSHVCNGGFLVTHAARNRGVGRLMGEGYLEWAPMLGYTYSVFNLVYETNVASCRIWDALGFKRIGRVKGAGHLKSHPDQLIDALIYGRDLGPDGDEYVSDERFDKIKFYLRHGEYPTGADRAEKSRLRSAAMHYKLLDDDRLMLNDREVVSDPQKQYEIARSVHLVHHGGINKTTASIAEKYHWVRIKETVSLVIRNCTACKELAKAPVVRPEGDSSGARSPVVAHPPADRPVASVGNVSAAGRVLSLSSATRSKDGGSPTVRGPPPARFTNGGRPPQPTRPPPTASSPLPPPPPPSFLPRVPPATLSPSQSPPFSSPSLAHISPPQRQQAFPLPAHDRAPIASMGHPFSDYADLPLDPQLLEEYHPSTELDSHLFADHPTLSHSHPVRRHATVMPAPSNGQAPHSHPPHTDYQALLASDSPLHGHGHGNGHGHPHDGGQHDHDHRDIIHPHPVPNQTSSSVHPPDLDAPNKTHLHHHHPSHHLHHHHPHHAHPLPHPHPHDDLLPHLDDVVDMDMDMPVDVDVGVHDGLAMGVGMDVGSAEGDDAAATEEATAAVAAAIAQTEREMKMRLMVAGFGTPSRGGTRANGGVGGGGGGGGGG